MEAIINGIKINLCNIYAPNQEDADFFHKVNKIAGAAENGLIIVGGDFIPHPLYMLYWIEYHTQEKFQRIGLQYIS